MFCKRWGPEELLPKADSLADLLLTNRHVTGVALTGSLARREPKIHDIGLAVFHDGTLKDGTVADPPGPAEYNYENSFSLDTAFHIPESGLVECLRRISSAVPVNYIFAEEKVLWDCGYLQSLEARENFQDFYRRVFCDIPLILLRAYQARGLLRTKAKLNGVIQVAGHTAFYIGHFCDNPRCRPRETWNECRHRIKRRKMHWWHPFMSIIGR